MLRPLLRILPPALLLKHLQAHLCAGADVRRRLIRCQVVTENVLRAHAKGTQEQLCEDACAVLACCAAE